MPEVWLYGVGASQEFTVPPGVAELTVTVWGGAAQAIAASLAVTGGDVFVCMVGGAPEDAPVFGQGGWNGGGDGEVVYDPGADRYETTAGWGASDVRRGGSELADRLLVAGGKSGLTLTENDGTLGFGSDTGAIDPPRHPVNGPQPGPGDPPRVPDFSPGPGYTLLDAGVAGGVTAGAAGRSIAVGSATVHAGAGGGGFGGGGSSGLYHWDDDPGDGGLYVFGGGGQTGGWFAAAGVEWTTGSLLGSSNPGQPDDYTGGAIRFAWVDVARGWNLGHLGY